MSGDNLPLGHLVLAVQTLELINMKLLPEEFRSRFSKQTEYVAPGKVVIVAFRTLTSL